MFAKGFENVKTKSVAGKSFGNRDGATILSNPAVTIGSKRSQESSKEAQSVGIHRNNSLSPKDAHPIENQSGDGN